MIIVVKCFKMLNIVIRHMLFLRHPEKLQINRRGRNVSLLVAGPTNQTYVFNSIFSFNMSPCALDPLMFVRPS